MTDQVPVSKCRCAGSDGLREAVPSSPAVVADDGPLQKGGEFFCRQARVCTRFCQTDNRDGEGNEYAGPDRSTGCRRSAAERAFQASASVSDEVWCRRCATTLQESYHESYTFESKGFHAR